MDEKIPGIDHLRGQTQTWIRDLVRSYTFEPVQLKLLVLAAEAWERTMEAREILKRDGLCVEDRFGQVKKHPATMIERDNRTSFSRLMKQLKLDLDPPEM